MAPKVNFIFPKKKNTSQKPATFRVKEYLNVKRFKIWAFFALNWSQKKIWFLKKHRYKNVDRKMFHSFLFSFFIDYWIVHPKLTCLAYVLRSYAQRADNATSHSNYANQGGGNPINPTPKRPAPVLCCLISNQTNFRKIAHLVSTVAHRAQSRLYHVNIYQLFDFENLLKSDIQPWTS